MISDVAYDKLFPTTLFFRFLGSWLSRLDDGEHHLGIFRSRAYP